MPGGVWGRWGLVGHRLGLPLYRIRTKPFDPGMYRVGDTYIKSKRLRARTMCVSLISCIQLQPIVRHGHRELSCRELAPVVAVLSEFWSMGDLPGSLHDAARMLVSG